MPHFRTILQTSEGFYKEKGSKFLAFAVPCKTEEEAKIYLHQWHKEHNQAVHVCYAFRFGSDKKLFRASDDGEPSNSAGPPILGQIQSFDVTNILVAVVRYYGGTNLGVGGLINAYRTASKEALELAEIVELEDEQEITISFTYEQMPQVMKIVKSQPCKIITQSFEVACVLKVSLPLSNSTLQAQLQNLDGVELESVKV